MMSETVYKALINQFWDRYQAYERNIYLYSSESDILFIDHNHWTTEIEVKVSRGDFLADFKKSEKHSRFKALHDTTDIPNYFYFGAQAGLINPEELPEYAGLIEVLEIGPKRPAKIVKKALPLHNNRLEGEQYIDLYYKSKQ